MEQQASPLFDWIAEQASGSIRGLFRSLQWFTGLSQQGLRPWLWLRALSDIGFVEYDAGSWSASKPILTTLPQGDGLLLLSGAHTTRDIDSLRKTLKTATVHLTPRGLVGGYPVPPAVHVETDTEFDIRSEFYRLKWRTPHWRPQVVWHAGPAIGRCLPQVDWIRPRVAGPVFGSELSLLNPRRMLYAGGDGEIWESAQSAMQESGLFSWNTHGRKWAWLSNGEWEGTDRDEGIYLAIRESECPPPLHWIPRSTDSIRDYGELRVPFEAGLPRLQARALTLCSGLLPSREGHFLSYVGIPESLALSVAESVGQPALQSPLNASAGAGAISGSATTPVIPTPSQLPRAQRANYRRR